MFSKKTRIISYLNSSLRLIHVRVFIDSSYCISYPELFKV